MASKFTMYTLRKTRGSKNKGSSYMLVKLKVKNTIQLKHLGLRCSGFSF